MDNDEEEISEEGLPCKDKLPFKTKEEAIGAIALAKHRYGSDSHKVYKCKDCEQWHITRA